MVMFELVCSAIAVAPPLLRAGPRLPLEGYRAYPGPGAREVPTGARRRA
jgi:hypothetical protein